MIARDQRMHQVFIICKADFATTKLSDMSAMQGALGRENTT
jgi:hypothetical protein